MYSETKVRILNSLNGYLQDVLELTPTIDLITCFWILSILVVSYLSLLSNSIYNWLQLMVWPHPWKVITFSTAPDIPPPMYKIGRSSACLYKSAAVQNMSKASSYSSTTSHCVALRNLTFNPINAELNPICHLLALLGAHHILHVSRIRVNYTNIFGQL